MEKIKNKKIVFLDRDGVINKKADEHCYITEVENFIFNDGIFDVCSKLKDQDFEFIVITNQRGVARGLYSEEKLIEIHEYMKDKFHKHGIKILDVFYCPHNKDVCDCRKPKDGMLRQACLRYNIDLHGSVLISDSNEDVQMGNNFGIGKNILVQSNKPSEAMGHLQK